MSPRVDGDGRGPGLMLFAPTGELISVNDDALAWLDELPPDSIDATCACRWSWPGRYVEAIFEKVGVSTRDELVAKIFTEHYAPTHLHPGSHDVVDP